MINLLDLMGGHFHDKTVELIKAGNSTLLMTILTVKQQ